MPLYKGITSKASRVNTLGAFAILKEGKFMTRQQIEKYQDVEQLRLFLNQLKGMKFKLDCGHHVTFGFFLGNDVIIRNGRIFRVICSLCGY